MIGLQKDCVSLRLIDEEKYKLAYEEEHEKLANLLEGYFVSIEHVGSTAIPRLVAKPIIDIAVGIIDINCFNRITSILENHGYGYLINNGDVARRIFVKTHDDIRTHHIHIEEYGKENWINHVLFREKLLASELLKNEYEELKIQLSKIYAQDRKKYTSGKADFIQRVLHEEVSK